MAILLARIELPHSSGLPEDSVVHDLSFGGATDIDDAAAAIANFYTVPQANAISISGYLSSVLSRTVDAALINWYAINTAGKLAGTDPLGAPIQVDAFTLDDNAADSDLPSEVAVALSFRADYDAAEEEVGATRPRARRRGRVFIGPLCSQVTQSVGDGVPPRPSTLFTGDLISAAQSELMAAAGTVQWGVWSRADAQVRVVTHLFVDNAFDTIRARGEAPTSRLVYP